MSSGTPDEATALKSASIGKEKTVHQPHAGAEISSRRCREISSPSGEISSASQREVRSRRLRDRKCTHWEISCRLFSSFKKRCSGVAKVIGFGIYGCTLFQIPAYCGPLSFSENFSTAIAGSVLRRIPEITGQQMVV